MASYRDWTGVTEEASTFFTPLDGRWLERYSGPPFGLKKSQTGIALLLSFSFLFNTAQRDATPTRNPFGKMGYLWTGGGSGGQTDSPFRNVARVI